MSFIKKSCNEISTYKERERSFERERDQLFVQLQVLRRECLEKEKEEERLRLEREKEEEKCKREAAERGHRESQQRIAELEREVSKHSDGTTSCHDGCTFL